MAKFLTTKSTVAEIENLIRTATDELIIISPYIQLSDHFKRRLKDSDRSGVQLSVVCRLDDLRTDQIGHLEKLAMCTIYDEPNLHAKCFASERGLVLGSLNLYEASEENWEMGVYLGANEDRQLYEEAFREACSIRDHAKDVSLRRKTVGGLRSNRKAGSKKRTERDTKAKKWRIFGFGAERGFCIRCGAALEYDRDRPYCRKHYAEWARYQDPTYGDDFCHSCGKRDYKQYTKEKPECYDCYCANAAA